jgi:hypothetical protein
MFKPKIIISVTVFLFLSCTKPFVCEETERLEDSFLLIDPYHTTLGNYFYPEDEFRSPYKKDSLKVFNEDGKKFELVRFLLNSDPANPLNRIYTISVAPAFIIPDDKDAFESEKTRNIYLKYNHNTSDTLTLVFKAYKTKCKGSLYEYLKIYHRNQLIYSVTKNTYAEFKLNH